MRRIKHYILLILLVALITAALSAFANIAYIYSLCFFSGWIAVGHLVTLDEDMPGEWGNLEESPKIWRRSRIELLVKLVVFMALIALLSAFLDLREFGIDQ